MTAYQRRLLAAIDAESRERRGPCPQWLAAVAVNAGGQAARDTVDGELIQLVVDGLLATNPEGLVLTAAGRAALVDAPTASQEVCQKPAKPLTPTAAEVDEPQANEGNDPHLRALLADLGGLVAERIQALRVQQAPHCELLRLQDMGRRIIEHTGGPRS